MPKYISSITHTARHQSLKLLVSDDETNLWIIQVLLSELHATSPICHTSHKKYIYREEMTGKFISIVFIRFYLDQSWGNDNARGCMEKLCLIDLQHIKINMVFIRHLYHQNNVSLWFLMSHKRLIVSLIVTVSLTWPCWGILHLITRVNNSYDKVRWRCPRSSRVSSRTSSTVVQCYQLYTQATNLVLWWVLSSNGALNTRRCVVVIISCWMRERKYRWFGHTSSQTQNLYVFSICLH